MKRPDELTDSAEEIEPKKAKIEQEGPPSGRQIIEQYLKGDITAAVTYRKICNALESFECWKSDVPKLQLLEQFLNVADLLEVRTDALVNVLLKIRWNSIPKQIFEKYRNFICEIAVRQLCFTEIVVNSVVERFVPQCEIDEETGETKFVLDEGEQWKHYESAHIIISNILRCFPMSAKTVLKLLRKNIPHVTQSIIKTTAYLRNLIVVQKYCPKNISKDLWESIFERLARDDAHNWKCEQSEDEINNRSPALFALNHDELINDVETVSAENQTLTQKKSEQMYHYLDSVITDIISYISIIHGVRRRNFDEEWYHAFKFAEETKTTGEEVFDMFIDCLESKMVIANHVRHVSFVWLYLCSLNGEYVPKMLESLWQVTCRMPRAPADAKKSQGAAAYLAAYLARAKYVDKKTAFTWLETVFDWLRLYVDQFASGSSQILPGLQRHGTFYAIAQSFFLVFAFRYRDFAKTSEMMDEVRRWGIGRVVHSQLEPLKYVSRPVAVCFSAISRSLQLVYCNHVIPIEEIQRPFEDMFPFDSYHLKVSSEFVTGLMRKFSPLAEDVSTLTAALSWNAVTAEKQKEGEAKMGEETGLEFLDDDEDFVVAGSYRERSGTCGQSSLINYSATPGLKSFGV